MNKEKFRYLNVGDKVIISRKQWMRFLNNYPDILTSGWDLLVPELTIAEVGMIPFETRTIYAFKFRGKTLRIWHTEIEEIA